MGVHLTFDMIHAHSAQSMGVEKYIKRDAPPHEHPPPPTHDFFKQVCWHQTEIPSPREQCFKSLSSRRSKVFATQSNLCSNCGSRQNDKSAFRSEVQARRKKNAFASQWEQPFRGFVLLTPPFVIELDSHIKVLLLLCIASIRHLQHSYPHNPALSHFYSSFTTPCRLPQTQLPPQQQQQQ